MRGQKQGRGCAEVYKVLYVMVLWIILGAPLSPVRRTAADASLIRLLSTPAMPVLSFSVLESRQS